MHFDEQFYRFLELYQNGKEMPMIFLRSEEPMVSRVRTNGYRETAFGLDSLLLSENMSCSDVDSRARSTENDREWSKLNRIADEIYTIERLNDTNLFFAVNEFRYNPFLTRKSSTEKGGIRRKKQCLKAFHFLYVDVDFKDCEELRGTYPTEEDIQKVKNKYLPEIMNMLGTALPPATMIVMSGHGIHIYWKIKKLLHNSRLGTGNSLFWYVAQ
ncbi:MAG: hypothetical protein IJX95_00705, partial [Lachnospiraceae bacterium]|nr:hypothetical protein [Lachnospiraceae bacterium]